MTYPKSLETTSELDKRIDDILAIVNALELSTQVGRFRDWLGTYDGYSGLVVARSV